MEKHGDTNSSNKQRKTKAQISFSGGGGGNIGGIVLWGGALAVAGLAAAFAVKRGGGRRSPRTTKKDDQAGQGLCLVLRNSSPTFQTNSCTSNGSTTELVTRKISSCEADSTESLILVEKTNNCRNENVTSGNWEEDNSREDEIGSCKNYTMIEEFSFPTPDHPSSQLAESRIEDDLADKLPLIEEEKEVDVLNESTHNTSSIHSASAEPQKNDMTDKFPLMEEEGEVDVLNESTDKTLSIHSASAEEEPQKNDINDEAMKEIRLVERIEAWKEEEPFDNGLKTSEYLTSVIHSVEKESDGDKNDVDLNIVESMEVAEEQEPPYASKIDSNKTSSEHSMEEGDKETLKELLLIENIKVLEKHIENCGVSNMTTNMTSLKHSVEEDDVEEEEEEEEDEDEEEDIMEKAEENSEETESTSAGSNADEIWPEEEIEALSQELKNSLQYSLAKTAEDQTISSEDCSSNFDNRKNSKLKNCIDDYQTTQTPTLLKKEESEFAMANDQPKSVTNWTNLNWVRHMLLLALMVVVFFFTHHSAIYLFP